MSWATVADMLARYNRDEHPELAQLTGAAGGLVDEVAVQAALDVAASAIRAHLGARAMPGAQSDPALREIQCDLARWNLYRDGVTDRVQQRYEAAINTLKAMAKGEQQAGAADAGDPGGMVAVMTSGTDPTAPTPRRRGF